jgi:hypothetical protein
MTALALTILQPMINAAPRVQRARPGTPKNATRYLAVLRDGSTEIGPRIDDWHHINGKPRINNRQLFDPNNPVRLIRDTLHTPKLAGPYVELANGDLLPGQLTGVLPADRAKGLPLRAVVRLNPPFQRGDGKSEEIAIRPDYIVRAVFTAEAAGPIRPGTIVFADGRRVATQALRWTESGVRGLLSDNSFSAVMTELAEIHAPRSTTLDPIEAVLDDIRAPCPDPDSPVARMQTADGGVFTFRPAMMQMASRNGVIHLVQPVWSYDTIAVPLDHMASCSFRAADEIPLSLLPADTLAERSFSGFVWPWRKNESVRRASLAAGAAISDLGLGTHSYSEIAFRLPPAARRIFARVGIDRNMATGGCAVCKIFRNEVSGNPAWQSGFLTSGEEPAQLEINDLQNAQRLVLVTDYGHQGRPNGADPLDIRDEVNWLDPLVQIDRNALPPSSRDLPDWVPQIAGWQISDEHRARIRVVPYWHPQELRWIMAMTPQVSGKLLADDTLFAFTTKMKVSPANAWIDVAAAKDNRGTNGHRVSVQVNGERHGTIMNGDILTNKSPGEYDDRRWTLGPFADQEIELAVLVHPMYDGEYEVPGIVWDHISVLPIIRNLPPDGKPIKPDVPLTSLKFLEYQAADGAHTIQPGKLTNGKPLTIRGYPFDDGFGILGGDLHKVEVHLDETWRRFVAVVGLADGANEVGPFEIWLDDQLHWPTDENGGESASFVRHTTGLQIDVEIPPGHKKLTLRLKGRADSHGGWANVGFLTD